MNPRARIGLACPLPKKRHKVSEMRVAAYARYSSDLQRQASLDDQLRNCRARCNSEGWPEPAIFTDAGISGARNDRAAFLRLMSRLDGFDVVLVDDLTRFGRDKDEVGRNVKRMVFAGVRLIGVSDGVDTERKGHKVEVGLRGLMAELFLDDLAEKTHRGLTGRALAGASAGGLPYGYRVTDVGQRDIDEAQASVVRRIFTDYLHGHSAREIALALNREGVPSSRGGTWAASAIHGDLRRGIGILVNPIYCGRQIWNRSHWIKHPETGRRVRKERPESEWIITDHPELAIVDADTFDAAQARLRSRRLKTPGGSHPRYVLSGILRCGQCGGPMVAIDRYRYGCATAKDRGTCSSRIRFARAPAEDALLAGVRRELLSEAAFKRFQHSVQAALKRYAPDPSAAKISLASAERQRQNILAALRAGIITPSTRAELLAAEKSVAEAQRALEAIRRTDVAQILPRAREVWRRLVAELGSDRRAEVREAVRELIGTASVIEENGKIFAQIESGQIRMVAGAGYVPSLTTRIRIQISRQV